MTPFDPEIERTAQVIRRVVREVTIDQRNLVEENSLISSSVEEEITMAAVPPPSKLGDYYKRTDEGHVSRRFVPADPTNFDINNYVLSSLRDNPFDENTIRDP